MLGAPGKESPLIVIWFSVRSSILNLAVLLLAVIF